MGEITVRDLRNRSADALRRVERGERLTVTRDGEPVASLIPLPRKTLRIEELIERRKTVPAVDAEQLRRDVDSILDSSL